MISPRTPKSPSTPSSAVAFSLDHFGAQGRALIGARRRQKIERRQHRSRRPSAAGLAGARGLRGARGAGFDVVLVVVFAASTGRSAAGRLDEDAVRYGGAAPVPSRRRRAARGAAAEQRARACAEAQTGDASMKPSEIQPPSSSSSRVLVLSLRRPRSSSSLVGAVVPNKAGGAGKGDQHGDADTIAATSRWLPASGAPRSTPAARSMASPTTPPSPDGSGQCALRGRHEAKAAASTVPKTQNRPAAARGRAADGRAADSPRPRSAETAPASRAPATASSDRRRWRRAGPADCGPAHRWRG